MEKIYQADQTDHCKGVWRWIDEKTPKNKALEYFFKYINPMKAIDEHINDMKKQPIDQRFHSDNKDIEYLCKVRECLKPIISKPGCY